MVVVAESRETNGARRSEMAAKITEVVSRGLGLAAGSRGTASAGEHPKTSSGKIGRRERRQQLYLAGHWRITRRPRGCKSARLGAGGAVSATGRAIANGVKRGLEFLYGIYFAVVFSLWIVPTWMIVQLYNGSSSGGKIHEQFAEDFIFPDWMQKCG